MSTRQFSIDFTQKLSPMAQQRIEDGKRQADENADGRWKHIIQGCILAAARRLAELTVDDVLEEYDKLVTPPDTHNMAAIGPAMSRAREMGVIRKTERIIRSTRPEKRGNFHRVWASNYYASRRKRNE